DHTGKVIWMNRTDERPILQLFTCSTEILKGLPVEELYLSHSPRRGHEPGNVVNDLPPRELSGTQVLLSPFVILDVSTGSVPFEDVARIIPEWIGANQEPAICRVETANPRLGINRSARIQARLPFLDKSLAVIRMNRFRPAPSLRLFRG